MTDSTPITTGGSTSETPSRPATFAEAFAASEAAPSEVSTASDQTTDAAPAIPEPPATGAPVDPPLPVESQAGPIPLERHKAILESTRKKAADEALATWRQSHGWAEQIPQQQFQDLMAFAQRASQPQEFIRDYVGALLRDPVHAPQVRSELARFLGTRPAAAPAQHAEPQADVPLVDAAGTPTGQYTYSAKAMAEWRAWNNAQLKAEMAQDIAPLQKAYQESQHREKVAEMTQQATAQADSFLKTMRAKPHFTDHEAAIKAKAAELLTAADGQQMQMPAHEAVMQAYIDVLTGSILPGAQQTATQAAIDTLKQKAVASTTTAAASAPAPRRFSTFDEALRHFAVAKP
jgi:hypothetical protein